MKNVQNLLLKSISILILSGCGSLPKITRFDFGDCGLLKGPGVEDCVPYKDAKGEYEAYLIKEMEVYHRACRAPRIGSASTGE